MSCFKGYTHYIPIGHIHTDKGSIGRGVEAVALAWVNGCRELGLVLYYCTVCTWISATAFDISGFMDSLPSCHPVRQSQPRVSSLREHCSVDWFDRPYQTVQSRRPHPLSPTTTTSWPSRSTFEVTAAHILTNPRIKPTHQIQLKA